MTHYHNCDCYDCRRSRARRDRRIRLLIGAVCLALGVLVLSALFGCSSTVTPAPIQVQQASFDQGEQNSGIIKLLPDGALITPRARDRYNALVAIYGREFIPAITVDYGVSRAALPQNGDGLRASSADKSRPQSTAERDAYTISNESLQKFILMNAWHRMGREPGKTKQP